jgi:hypothetical protein
MEFSPVEAQDAVNFARSEAENERLRGRIAGLEKQQAALAMALQAICRSSIDALPCTCNEPVAARPVQCLRHQIVRVRP